MRRLVALGAVAMLAFGARALADTTVHGTVDAVVGRRVTVSGQSYAIRAESELTDLGGARLQLSELRPGTPVDLDLDDSGQLVVLRAAVVR
jgi:hypothetical protein